MKIAFGCDHAGVDLREAVLTVLREAGAEVVDFGTDRRDSVDYPDVAAAVGRAVADGTCERGILVCGTGIGVSIAANKVPGVRAALCQEPFTAALSREHNDANVLCMGARVIGPGLARAIVTAWLQAPFGGGRHAGRIEKIAALERS